MPELEGDYRDLHAGTGRWRDTIQGGAARRLHDARHHLDQARQLAVAPTVRRRDRRSAARSLPTLRTAFADAERHWRTVAQPTAEQLRAHINGALRHIDGLDATELIQRLDQLEHGGLARSVDPELGIAM